MALNSFFLNSSSGEQGLLQDLINEQIRMFGVEVIYIPRKFVRKETAAKITEKEVVIPESSIYTRSVWETDTETPIFSQEKGYLRWLMPKSQDDKTPVLENE